jgi:glycosyltransferase 2 family protein
VINDRKPAMPRRNDKVAIIAAKLLVTGVCFWYLSWQIDLQQVIFSIPHLDYRWAALAILIVMLQIPLIAIRWREILRALDAIDQRMTITSLTVITAIGSFFAQALPSIMGDGIRAWLLVRLGCDWRRAVTSVVIDRGVGVGLLIAMGFVILLLPSGLSALGEYRDLVLLIYGASLLAGAVVFLFLPRLVPLLDRVPYVSWITALAASARRVILGPRCFVILGLGCLVHALTILVIWWLGRAQGLVLPIPEAAVLFVVVLGVELVPISINGWGLRELAVVALLGRYGVASEQALVFSVCFGLVLAVASLPGALAWLFAASASTQASFGDR